MSDPLRIVFMGSPDFAVSSLDALVGNGFKPVAVVTGPDKRRGRGGVLSPTPVKACAISHHLHVIETDSLKDPATQSALAALRPDLFVVVAFKILPKALLSVPKIGSINVHASLLPKYRGAAPIHWAIANGETETGVTIFFLNEGIDTGGILLSRRTPIGPDETTGDVYERLAMLGSEALIEAIHQIRLGEYTLLEQNEAGSCGAPKIFPDDTFLNLDAEPETIRNHVRAFNPFPGAWVLLDGKKLMIHRTEVSHADSGDVSDPLRIRAGSGHIRFTEVQLEGKSRLAATDFIRGYNGKWVIQGKKEYI